MIAGRYSLDREIGRGGMGSVWLGHDELLDRVVAIKRMPVAPPGLHRDRPGDDLARAEREARVAASLNHRNVVAVFDFVGEAAERFLVMEYVEGTDLSALLRSGGALTPDAAADILRQAAQALAAAHAAGIVHRDVKPSNLLVGLDGVVKLSDFGIARAPGDDSLTSTGLVTGSPAYLAPEVASGGSASAASDVWSLGATAFHAVTGHPAYDVGDNLLGALYRIVHEDPPRADGAGWLAPVLAHTMVRDPARRWTMAQVHDALAAGPQASGTTAPQPGPGSVIAFPVDRATRRTAPVAAPLDSSAAASEPTVALAPVGAAAASHPMEPGDPARTRMAPRLLVALVALVVLGVVGVLGVVLVAGGRGPADPTATGPTSAPTTSSSPPQSSGTPVSGPPTRQGMAAFVRDYVATAARDPARGFAQLTPAYQRSSGGLSSYEHKFWNRVDRVVRVYGISADPANLAVTYTYTYDLAGVGQTTDTVVMRLVYDAATQKYKIDGAETV